MPFNDVTRRRAGATLGPTRTGTADVRARSRSAGRFVDAPRCSWRVADLEQAEATMTTAKIPPKALTALVRLAESSEAAPTRAAQKAVVEKALGHAVSKPELDRLLAAADASLAQAGKQTQVDRDAAAGGMPVGMKPAKNGAAATRLAAMTKTPTRDTKALDASFADALRSAELLRDPTPQVLAWVRKEFGGSGKGIDADAARAILATLERNHGLVSQRGVAEPLRPLTGILRDVEQGVRPWATGAAGRTIDFLLSV
jgi:hypothetical protein